MAITKASGLMLASALALTGCGAGKETRLPGLREDLRADLASAPVVASAENKAVKIALPKQQSLSSWSHRAGGPTHVTRHAALGAGLTPVWSAPIGEGNDRRHRITAEPVAAAGRVFTLDSRARVSATGTNGAALWSVDLTPPGEKDDASGGGMAVAGGVLYVTTGFGELVALDAASGAEVWAQRLEAAGTGAPTVVGDTVYVVSSANRAWSVDARTGLLNWQITGTPAQSAIVGGPGPAVNGDIAIFPMSTGDLVATFPKGGTQLWSSALVGGRETRAYGRVSDISADPIILGKTVYVGNQSGRVAALDIADGSRIWTAKEGAYSPLLVTGGSVFLISDLGELVRLSAADGARIWGTQLPFYTTDKERRQRDVHAHFGPILAGGRLWVGSSDGLLRAFDPVSGALAGSVEIAGGAASNPIVIDGTLFILSAKGALHAFR